MTTVTGSSTLDRTSTATARRASRQALVGSSGSLPVLAPPASGPSAPVLPAVGCPPTTARPVRPAKRPRTLVIEPDPDRSGDRLDAELDVRMRAHPPATSQHLALLLAEHRPQVVLYKHPLDRIATSSLAVCAAYDVAVYVLADPMYGVFKPVRLWRFGGLPWLLVQRRNSLVTTERLKRVIDLTVIVSSVPLWLPLMVLIALVVGSNGSPLYFQERVGAGGRLFRMVKFRSMRPDAEASTGPVLAAPMDHRTTRIGVLLRRLRFDELPQIWNVLCGHMSLVGPRPERPEFVAELRQLPDYDLRHLIRPGLTGIAQLTGGYAATPEEKLRCDLLYLNGRTLRSDLMLLAMTVLELFRGFPRG